MTRQVFLLRLPQRMLRVPHLALPTQSLEPSTQQSAQLGQLLCGMFVLSAAYQLQIETHSQMRSQLVQFRVRIQQARARRGLMRRFNQ